MQRQKKTNRAMTDGVIWKQIMLFFFPILIGVFFQQLYNTIDAVIVGRFAGKEALASIGGSASQILSFLFTFFMGLSAGATVLIAQYFGAGQSERVDKALHTAYAFALAGGVGFGILGMIITKPFLILTKAPSELLGQTSEYMYVLFAGLVFTLIFNIGSGILRAVGDSKRPLYILILCCLLNIVLDIVFVLFFRLGVLGAAIATVIAQAVSAAYVTYLLMKKTDGLNLSLNRLRIDGRMLKRVLKIGLPTALAGSMFAISNIILQSSFNRMGINEVAAWASFGKVDAIWWMINQAFSTSVMTFVGQNYGAGKGKRIRKGVREVLIIETIAAACFSVIMLLFNQPLLRLFTADEGVLAVGAVMVMSISPFYALFPLNEILGAALRAEGNVMITTIANVLGACVFRIIWLVFLFPHGTIQQVTRIYPIGWAIISFVVTTYYILKQKQILAAHCADVR